MTSVTATVMDRLFDEIAAEVYRQVALKEAGRFAHVPADPIPDLEKLMEEVGEVAKAIMEAAGSVTDSVDIKDGKIVGGKGAKHKDLRKELIQVAAIAVSWLIAETD